MSEQLPLPLASPTRFYRFHQNNSGGHFFYDDKVGENVVIEAHSSDEANARAEGIGIYFDGCDDGRDCDCCGDRWSRAWRTTENNGWDTFASVDEAIAAHAPPHDQSRPWDRGSQVVIHYLDGKVEWHNRDLKF